MELKDIISRITISKEWHDSYCELVPQFIESAKSYENWQDWDKDLFYEFFERGRDHCVSSLQQGYFTNEEKARIKEHWNELSPMLKAIAESQDEPLWNVYNDIKSFIRKHTELDRRAGTNRLIASLQPNILCTIVQEWYLRETFNLLNDAGIPNVPEFDSSNWFKSSYLLMDYFKSNVKYNTPYELCTYAWQVRDYLKDLSENQFESINKMESYVNLLKSNKNLVLTGAPGTGKTYLAKQIACSMLFGKTDLSELSDKEHGIYNECVTFVQFHPSYDYTDFVEGLRPIRNKKDTIVFERKDGVFKYFCKKAYEGPYDFDTCYQRLVDLILSEPNQELTCYTYGSDNIPFKIYYENDEITFKKGDNDNKRTADKERLRKLYSYYINKGITDVRKANNVEMINIVNGVSIPYTNYRGILQAIIDLHGDISQPYIFIIDEINRGEISKIFGELFYAIDPGYRGITGKIKTQYQNLIEKNDTFSDGFFIPENVYILATMNDIDRSVESMDFALRRRFAWKEIKPEDRLEMLKENLNSDICEKAKRVMTALNNAISNTRGLGSAYQIGPAYFLKLKDENYNGDFDKLWEMHIEIVLKEYLRGYSNADAKVEEFKKIYSEAINDSRIVATD